MRQKLTFVVLAALSAGLSAWLSSACGSDGAQPSSTLSPQAVGIESISPPSGPLGTEVVIRGSGFTSVENDVGFSNPKIDFQGQHTGYLNGLSSPDGRTLRFRLPDNDDVLLSACAFSQLKSNEECPDIGLLLPTGESEVFVINQNGKSNTVTFSVSGPPTSQPSPFGGGGAGGGGRGLRPRGGEGPWVP